MVFEARISTVANRLDGEASDVWAVHDRALEMQEAGEDVILLCVGDPNFPTPAPIIEHAKESLAIERTHYSPNAGELSLRKAIAELETRSSPHPCSPDEVVIFPGGTNALYSVMQCLLDVGDEIIVPDPMYIGYCGVLDAVGAEAVTVPLDSARNFAMDVEAIKAAVTPRTKAVMINTPGNPAGNIATPEQMRELARFCYEHNLWLISDEVYCTITFEQRHVSLRAAAERLDNVILIDSLSKSHAMSGWRLGWVVAPTALVKHLSNFAGASVFGCPQFIQDAAAFALAHDEYYVAQMRDEYRRRRDYLVERINRMPGLHCQAPQAGMFVMVDISGVADDGQAFAEALLDAAYVSVVPGAGFGPSARQFVRITLAQSMEALAEAMDRLEAFLREGNSVSTQQTA